MGNLGDVIINTDTGQRGSPADFVSRFSELWARPKEHAKEFDELLARDVRLIAPMTPTTTDRVSGSRALRKVFRAVPDIRASVLRWADADDALFIEMRFTATIGGQEVTWNNVDRFRFVQGAATERTAYFDPSILRRALLQNARGWVQLVKLIAPLGGSDLDKIA